MNVLYRQDTCTQCTLNDQFTQSLHTFCFWYCCCLLLLLLPLLLWLYVAATVAVDITDGDDDNDLKHDNHLSYPIGCVYQKQYPTMRLFCITTYQRYTIFSDHRRRRFFDTSGNIENHYKFLLAVCFFLFSIHPTPSLDHPSNHPHNVWQPLEHCLLPHNSHVCQCA